MEETLRGLAPTTTWKNYGTPPAMRKLEGVAGFVCFGRYVQPVARDPLQAIVTIDPYGGDDGRWLHLSITRAKRLPTWEDLVTTRDALGYREWLFIQLLAPASAWLNIHNYCLHLQARLDRDTVPRVLWDQAGADGRTYGMHR